MLRHPIRWLRAHPKTADALLGVVFGVVGVVGLASFDASATSASDRDADLLAYAITVVQATCLAFRRTAPVPALAVSTATLVPFWVLDYMDAVTGLAVLILVYSVAAHVERPRSIQAVGIAAAVLVAVMLVGVAADEEDLPAVAVVANVIVFATAWALGDSFRNRRAYLAEVEARAERAERDRELATDRAVQEERTRIARELHDVVAHSVSVMVIQAGAARRVLDRSPQRAAESLHTIESTGRNALDELRRVLGVLRPEEPGSATAPQPTAGDVTGLVRRWRDAGHSVALIVHGSPPELPLGVGLTIYRVVQEALTNVTKHAGPAHADVCIRYEPDAVSLEVRDDGRGPVPESGDLPSSGQGLIGMRERVELFGGTLEVGRRPGGGFRVRARLPVRSPVAS